jgi:hypothetical protein
MTTETATPTPIPILAVSESREDGEKASGKVELPDSFSDGREVEGGFRIEVPDGWGLVPEPPGFELGVKGTSVF